MRRAPMLMALLLLAGLLRAQAQVVIYRCTDASGAVTVQNNVRCPTGSRQEKRIIDVPPPLPAYRAAAPQPRPAPQTPPETAADVAAKTEKPPAAAAADRTPPPALFACKTVEGDAYFSDSGEAPQRCVRMPTTGIGGLAGMGAGEACRVVSDECTAVEAAALCDAWKRRIDEAQFRWKFASTGERDTRKLAYERVRMIYAASTCAAPARP